MSKTMSKATEKQTIEGTYTATQSATKLTIGGITVQAMPVQVQVQPDHHFRAEVTITQDGNAVHLPLYQWREMALYVERQIGLVAGQTMSKAETTAYFDAVLDVFAYVDRHEREKRQRENTTTGSK